MGMEAVRNEITQLIDTKNHPEFIRGVYATLNIQIGGEVVDCPRCNGRGAVGGGTNTNLNSPVYGLMVCPVCNGALNRPRTLMDMIEEES